MKNIELEDGQSADIVSENVSKLKELFPDAFSEGGLNFDTLRQLLGDESVLDEGEEKYGLNWHGKSVSRQVALTPSVGTFLPCPVESSEWDTSQNLFLKGDNLEGLKLLQKSYANKVKMIYIDPPYNTGNEFIYPDNYKENLDTYLKYTGQVDSDGVRFSSNTETTGRMHTNWLNMMYPRLRLARSLLKSSGVIFISIDENEIANLRKICDEIFGEENFYCSFVWQRRSGSMDSVDNVSVDHEYVVCYGKSRDKLKGIRRSFEKYKNPDNDPRGPWIADNLSAGKAGGDVHYEIEDPQTGNKFLPPKGRYWPYSPKTMKQKIEEGRVIFPKKPDGRPMLKRFMNEAKSPTVPVSSYMRRLGEKNVSNALFSVLNTAGTKELQELFDEKIFSHPKSTTLIESLASQVLDGNENEIVLDFFAGSATTAHAVYQMNSKDNGNRRFILIQLPEPCDETSSAYKSGFGAITDIGIERCKKAANKIRQENPEYDGDLGFKVFELAESNLRVWSPSGSDIEQSLLDHENSLKHGREENDLLYELLLKRGIDLAAPIEKRVVPNGSIFSIGYGAIFACFCSSITTETYQLLVEEIVGWKKELSAINEPNVFFLDSSFSDDIVKSNIVAMLDQFGISRVKSI
jgi:adenine-specific DNA-methyltransferase